MTPARILVVEDDFVVARDIRQKLTRIGYSVVGSTARGEDALSLALELRPDLVLMDIRLEGIVDGIDAAEQIRQTCFAPVVFLTAYADDETVKRASLTEPFGYLIKPFEDFQLRTIIEVALYKHAADRKLRESERRFVATLSSIGDAVIATDDSARVTFMNAVAETLTGWPQAEAKGRTLSEVFRIVNEDTRQPVEDPAAKVLRLGTTVGLANHTVLLARDGRELPIDDSGSPIISDDNRITGTVLVFRDITERMHIEAELRKAQEDLARMARLTTIGELTASIAHEVSQPLMAIVTDAAACLSWLSKDRLNVDEAIQAAERIERDGHRAGDVVKSLRALTSKTPRDMVPLDINTVISDTLDMLRSELRHNEISLEMELSSRRVPIVGDRVQLQQVVLNLIKNGIEAMEAPQHRPRVLRVSSQFDGASSLQVVVADNGVGFNPATADAMFDAFFTTKPGGIGLGLSICRSIVEAHGGRLLARRNSPKGSVFCFILPAAADEAPYNGDL
jgi:PAS domain S-box-containing protein